MKQRYLKNFTGQKLLVIFMVICSSLINGKAISQTTYYVNDNNSTGDIFCSAVGSNSNSGTASAPFVTISYAINAAADGDLIYIDAGSYSENVTVNKRLTITGAGSSTSGTIVTAAAGSVFNVTASGTNASDRLIIKDIRATGSSASGISVTNSLAAGYYTFDNITALSNTDGISFAGTASVTDAIVSNSTLSSNANNGLRIASACPSFIGLTVSGCTMNSNAWQAFSYNPNGLNVIGTDFNFSNCTFTNNCTSNTGNGNHDLSFFGFKGNASLSNVTVVSNKTVAYGVTFTAQGLGFQAAGTISLSDVTISGTVGKGALTFQYYNDMSNVSMSNVDVSGCTAPWGQMVIQDAGTGTFNIGNTTLKTMALWSTGKVNATSAIFKNYSTNVVLNRSTLADCYTIENQITHATDAAGLGLARVVAGNVYVTTTSGSVQRGIDAATAGDVVNVDAGNYVNVSQISISKNLTITGAGSTSTNIKKGYAQTGQSDPGGNARAFILVTSGVNLNISGLKIDGNGNNCWQGIRHFGTGTISNIAFEDIRYEWGGAGVFYQGTAVASINSGGALNITNCTFSNIGRISALYYGSSSGTISGTTFTGQGLGDKYNGAVEIAAGANVSVQNSNITNYTGTAVTGTSGDPSYAFYVYGSGSIATIVNNIITNNLHAIALDANINANIHNNDLSSNTMAIEADLTAIVDADCNWWGSTSQAVIATKIQNLSTSDYTPWLNSGTDADGSTAGFQPVSGACAGAPLSLNESHVNVICSGATTGSIDLSVSGGTSPFSYVWTKSGDVSYSASTQDLSNLASGTYTVVVTDANSITATTSIEITSGTVVYPVITNQPTKVGRKVALNLPAEPYTITVASNSSITYQWYSNTTASNSGGVLIAGATSNSYTPPTSTAYTAYFYCVVSNGSCSKASNVSEVFIVCN